MRTDKIFKYFVILSKQKWQLVGHFKFECSETWLKAWHGGNKYIKGLCRRERCVGWRGVIKNRNIYIYQVIAHGYREYSNYEGVLLRFLYITIQTVTKKGEEINISCNYIAVVCKQVATFCKELKTKFGQHLLDTFHKYFVNLRILSIWPF